MQQCLINFYLIDKKHQKPGIVQVLPQSPELLYPVHTSAEAYRKRYILLLLTHTLLEPSTSSLMSLDLRPIVFAVFPLLVCSPLPQNYLPLHSNGSGLKSLSFHSFPWLSKESSFANFPIAALIYLSRCTCFIVWYSFSKRSASSVFFKFSEIREHVGLMPVHKAPVWACSTA